LGYRLYDRGNDVRLPEGAKPFSFFDILHISSGDLRGLMFGGCLWVRFGPSVSPGENGASSERGKSRLSMPYTFQAWCLSKHRDSAVLRPTLNARTQIEYEANWVRYFIPSVLANHSHALRHWCIKIGARSDSSKSRRQGNAKMRWRQRKKDSARVTKLWSDSPFPSQTAKRSKEISRQQRDSEAEQVVPQCRQKMAAQTWECRAPLCSFNDSVR